MKINLNYDALNAMGTIEEKRTALFDGLKGALLIQALGLAMMSPAEAAKASLGPQSRIGGIEEGKSFMPGEERIKSFLTGHRAAPYLGAKWAVPSDNPHLQTTTGHLAGFFADGVSDIDLGYQVLFDDVPGMLGGNQEAFDLIGASMGFTWDQRKPGAKVEPKREINENKVSVLALEFADGFGILDRWLQFSKYYAVADAINEFVAKYYDKKASLHYGLFTGQGAGIDQAFATDAATTFNAAVASIMRACEAKGYALGSNPQVDILVSPEKVGYVLAFLDATRGSPMIAFGTQKQPIAFSVRNVIVSTKVTAADTGYYVVLPGRKNKRADWKALTVETSRDAHASATDWVGAGQYNAIAGDSAQVRRVKFS